MISNTNSISTRSRSQVRDAVNEIGRRMTVDAITLDRDQVRADGRALAERLLGNADMYDLLVDIGRLGGHRKAVR